MRSLSIRQPWAHLIAHGPKRIENRTWRCDYRGLIAIHASKTMTREEYLDVADLLLSMGMRACLPPGPDLAFAAIVGVARIADCLAPGTLREARRKYPDDLLAWWAEGQYGLILDSVIALPKPVPCKGALWLWRVPELVEGQIREQLR